MENRTEKALQLSEEILEDIELEKLPISSIALRCLRLARLINDTEAMQWLSYETSGYTRIGPHTLENKAFNVAYKRGRKLVLEDPEAKRVFSYLPDELKAKIESAKTSLLAFRMGDITVNGDKASDAVNTYTRKIRENLEKQTDNISDFTNKLSIIRGNYYSYALSVNYELKFSGRVDELFSNYRTMVDNSIINLVPASLGKLDSIYNNLSSDNPESWSQSLTTCRRLFEDVANTMFSKIFHGHNGNIYKTNSGKEIDISGDKYMNRLGAVIDFIEKKKPKHTITGSHVSYIMDWIECLHSQLCKGVHSDITYDEAERAVLHTYFCLGDICSILKNEEGKIFEESKAEEVGTKVVTDEGMTVSEDVSEDKVR